MSRRQRFQQAEREGRLGKWQVELTPELIQQTTPQEAAFAVAMEKFWKGDGWKPRA